MRKTVLYVIDDLGRGGAETLLVGMLPALSPLFDIILVTLSGNCEFTPAEVTVKHRYSLGFKGKTSFISCAFRLKKLIKKHRPDLVHAHLVNSSIIVRMATPKTIPIICSLHSQLSKNVYDGSWIYKNLEKKLFRKEHIVTAASKEVLEDYQQSIGSPLHGFVLYNYVADEFFCTGRSSSSTGEATPLKFVAIGNIKKVKNYEFLIQAFSLLKNEPVSLDVYGRGEEAYLEQLKKIVTDMGANVTFKGPATEVHQVLQSYDGYIMSSLHEGFGIAAVEAMAIGLPVLLSDLPVLREVTDNNALFFSLESPGQLANIIKELLGGNIDTSALVKKGIHIAGRYSKEKYVDGLVSIYNNFVFHQS